MYLCVCCVYRHTLTDTQREREEEEEKHLYGTTFSRILFPTLFWLIVGHTRHFAWEFSRSYGSHSESHFGDSRVWCMSTLRITALLVHQLCRTAEPGAARVPSGACLGSSQSWAHTWLASWGTLSPSPAGPLHHQVEGREKGRFPAHPRGFQFALDLRLRPAALLTGWPCWLQSTQHGTQTTQPAAPIHCVSDQTPYRETRNCSSRFWASGFGQKHGQKNRGI